jgi:hypothetical protein
MKLYAIGLSTFLLTACGAQTAAPMVSPSGTLSAKAEISGDEAEPTRRLCVRLKIRDIATGGELTFQTGASTVHKWAIGWSPKNVLVLYSSDAGIFAYEVYERRIIERRADPNEEETGRLAYERKYCRRPIA